MKKIISFILVAILCLGALTSCAALDGIVDKITGLIGGEQGGETDDGLESAKNYVFTKYNGDNASPKADYDVAAKLVREGKTYTITWTVDNSKITVKESKNAGFWTIDLPAENDTEVKYVLTATITNAENKSVSVTFNRTLPVYSSVGVTTEPIEGVAYKLFMDHLGYGQNLYAIATTSTSNTGEYINTTNDPKQAADYYVEVVEGGFKIYTTINGVKNYVYANAVDRPGAEGKYNKYISLSATDASVFYYKEVGCWFTKIGANEFGTGTYGSNKTVGISEGRYYTESAIGTDQYVMQFITKEYAETLTPDEIVNTDPTADSTLTIEQAITLGESKGHDMYTEGKYYVTGEITEVYNTTYGNMKIKDANGKILTVYGTYDATGANRYDKMANAPVAGQTVTVYGIIGQYNGTAQMKNGWITAVEGTGAVTPPAEDEEEGGNENSEPAADSTLSIVDAVALGTTYKSDDYSGHYTTNKYYVSGVITKVKNVEKGELVIADAEGNTLTVYGAFDATGATAYKDLATKPVVGDTVTVYGVIGAYGPTVQLSNGWFTAHTAHTCNYAAATCGKASACEICGATTGAALGHTEANAEGRCDRCGVSFNPTEQAVAIAASTGALASDSLSISWAGNNVTVVSEKDTSTTNIRTSDTDHYRCYAGSKLTISGKNEEKISKIVITATSASYANVLAGSLVTAGVSAVADGSTVTVTVDAGTVDAVVFSCTAQTRINNVVVYYE